MTVAYREGDAEAQERAEVELAAREAIAPLAEEGRARREGRPTQALVPAPRQFELLPVAKVRGIIKRMPRGWATDARAALRAEGEGGWLEGTALVTAAAAGVVSLASVAAGAVVLTVGLGFGARFYATRFSALRREVSWVMSLPFDLHGYLELLPILDEHEAAVDIDLDLPPEGLALVEDLVERVRGDHAVTVTATPRGVSIVFATPVPPEVLRRLADEVLVPLHRLHRITHVGVRRARQVGEEHDHDNVVRRRSR